MHPIAFLTPIAIVYMAAAGYKHLPLWHILAGAALIGIMGVSRVALAHVGPIRLQTSSAGEALAHGFEQMRYRLDTKGVATVVLGHAGGGLFVAALIYGAGLLARRLIGG